MLTTQTTICNRIDCLVSRHNTTLVKAIANKILSVGSNGTHAHIHHQITACNQPQIIRNRFFVL